MQTLLRRVVALTATLLVLWTISCASHVSAAEPTFFTRVHDFGAWIEHPFRASSPNG